MNAVTGDKPEGSENETIAVRYLDVLYAHGVRHPFGNVGTDFPPVIEALIKGRKSGRRRLDPVIVPHGCVAAAMGYGV